MYLNTIFAGAMTLLSLASIGSSSRCDKGPFGWPNYVGKPGGGHEFCETKWDQGHVVTGIEVWAMQHHIKAIKLSYSDGSQSDIIGNIADFKGSEPRSFSWEASDRLSTVMLWTNKKKDGLGRIHIEIGNGNDKRMFTHGSETSGDGNGVVINPHSGILLGATGRTGAFFDELGWLFLVAAGEKARVTAVRFDEDLDIWNKEKRSVESTTLGIVVFKNSDPPSGPSKRFSLKAIANRTNTKTIAQRDITTFGATVGVTFAAGIRVPLFTESDAWFLGTSEYRFEAMTSESSSETIEHGLNWDLSGDVAPGYAARCSVYAQVGRFVGGYVSSVEIAMRGGTGNFTVTQPGRYSSEGWTAAGWNCSTISLSMAPKNAVEADDKEKMKTAMTFIAGR